MWSQFYQIFFKPDVVAFLGFMSFATASLGIFGFFTAGKPTEKFPSTKIPAAMQIPDPQSPQIPPLMLLRMTDFWFLAIIVFVVTGSGATALVNMGSMVLSVGGDAEERNALVFILSIANCLGRFLFGYLSDLYAHRLSKISFLCVISIMMGLSQVSYKSYLV